MGLDMYVERITSVYTHPQATKENPYAGNYRIVDTRDEVCYWRKFNALHNHIVNTYANGVDECQRIPLDQQDVTDIVELLKRVKDDHSLAPKLLPTGAGFFFGSTEYNEWYFGDVENAIEQLEKVLLETNFDKQEIVYQASW